MAGNLGLWGSLLGQNELCLIQKGPFLKLHLLRFHLVVSIPKECPFGSDYPPRSIPGSSKSVRAPTRAVRESDSIRHPENGRDGRTVSIPGIRRNPFIAKDGVRIHPEQEAHCIKRMDGHIGQKNVRHALAESAEVRAGKEINMNGGNFTYSSSFNHLAHLPDSSIEAPILYDRVNARTALSQINQT